MKLSLFSHARRGLLVLAAAIGMLFGFTAAPAQAQDLVYDGTFELRPLHTSNKCLEVADWSVNNGAAVRQWECTGGKNQKWERYSAPGSSTGPYWYKNLNSGRCLEIKDWATYNGALADQWDCHYGANQTWYGNSGQIYPDFTYASSKCLEIADWRTDNGAPARLWDCTYRTNSNQNFYFKRV
ncbi:RICIN domain-containing protein [Streptomyces sp. NPDC059695]|uniref:RICIN domain-containing protein n=1 Tax=Streptomyces sp. NPDC059695 TaxID=3346910 RepID=UPI00368DA5B2